MGPGAYQFIDFLAASGLNLWQVLPLGHTGFGDSPYQPFSAFAGQPLIIDIDYLRKKKLLLDEDFSAMPDWDPEKIDYGTLIEFKTGLLKKAYERFIDADYADDMSGDEELMAKFDAFVKNTSWLADYSLFMAGKDAHEGMPWYMWDDSLKKPTARQKTTWKKKLCRWNRILQLPPVPFYRAVAGKTYANDLGISIVGDTPIFLAWGQRRRMVQSGTVSAGFKGIPYRGCRCSTRLFLSYRSALGQPSVQLEKAYRDRLSMVDRGDQISAHSNRFPQDRSLQRI